MTRIPRGLKPASTRTGATASQFRVGDRAIWTDEGGDTLFVGIDSVSSENGRKIYRLDILAPERKDSGRIEWFISHTTSAWFPESSLRSIKQSDYGRI